MTTETESPEPLVRLHARVATDDVHRIADSGRLIEEIVVLSAATIGNELRELARIAAGAGQPGFGGWATLRPIVRSCEQQFTAALLTALTEGNEQLAQDVGEYPLQSERYEIIESLATMPNGTTTRMLQRKPIRPEPPLNVTIGALPGRGR